MLAPCTQADAAARGGAAPPARRDARARVLVVLQRRGSGRAGPWGRAPQLRGAMSVYVFVGRALATPCSLGGACNNFVQVKHYCWPLLMLPWLYCCAIACGEVLDAGRRCTCHRCHAGRNTGMRRGAGLRWPGCRDARRLTLAARPPAASFHVPARAAPGARGRVRVQDAAAGGAGRLPARGGPAAAADGAALRLPAPGRPGAPPRRRLLEPAFLEQRLQPAAAPCVSSYARRRWQGSAAAWLRSAAYPDGAHADARASAAGRSEGAAHAAWRQPPPPAPAPPDSARARRRRRWTRACVWRRACGCRRPRTRPARPRCWPARSRSPAWPSWSWTACCRPTWAPKWRAPRPRYRDGFRCG